MAADALGPAPIITDPPTHRRVQQVLHELVKEDRSTIEYSELLLRVRPVVLRSTNFQDSTFRTDVRRSVRRMHQLGHISLNFNAIPTVISITRAGKQFYTRLSPARVRRKRAPRGPRQSHKGQAMAEYLKWAKPLIRIQEIVAERSLNPQDKCPVNLLEAAVRSHMETADALRSDNGDLSLRIYDLSWESEQMERED